MLRQIFNEAREIADPRERAEYLAQACGADSALRLQVEELMAADAASGRFLGGTGDTVAKAARHARDAVSSGLSPDGKGLQQFGDYELIEEIARGGMGIVYKARQVGLNRIVAVKLLLLGQYASEEFIHRFRIEASAAASLQHPNIVAIHEVGVHLGQHYFAMDYVDGPDLAQLVRAGPLPARRAAGYVQIIAEAIHFAHTRRILHRDLKPSNVLIDSNDQPRLTDFGLAKNLGNDSDLTLTGQVMGSPGFMPPEQASGDRGKMGPLSDVYSLGAILYHALTGRAPFVGQTVNETLQQVQQQEPIPPRLLVPGVPVDLETICLKCLEKEPARRFASAQELVEELGRFDRGETLHARPVGRAEHLWRWCRRKPALAMLSMAVGLLVVTVTAGSSIAAWHVNVARRAEGAERQRAVEANRRSERANVHLAETINLLELQRAEDFFAAGDPGVALAYLAGVLRRDASNRIAAGRLFSALALRPFILPIGPPIRHRGQVTSVEYSPDGSRLVSTSLDHTAWIFNAGTGEPMGVPLVHSNPVLTAHFSPDGNWIVTASTDKSAQIWDARTGRRAPHAPPWGFPHDGVVYSARFSPDGAQILTASAGGAARVWNASSAAVLFELRGHQGEVNAARFSVDGTRIVTASADGTARLWDSRTGKLLGRSLQHQDSVLEACFSPNGALVLTASADGTARLWVADTGEALGAPMRHSWDVRVAQFSADGASILTASRDRSARIWSTATCLPLTEAFHHGRPIRTASFSPDASQILSAGVDNTVRLWRAQDGLAEAQPIRFAEQVVALAFNPAVPQFVTGSLAWEVQRWALPARRATPEPLFNSGHIHDFTFSPDGKWLITAAEAGVAQIWDAQSGQPVGEPARHRRSVNSARFSPDGKSFLTASTDRTAQLWDAETHQRRGAPMRHGEVLEEAQFSPDGTLVLTASWDHTARVWDARTGEPITAPLSHGDKVWSIAFSPDGRFVATGSRDQTARVWDAWTGAPVTDPLLHLDHVDYVTFSPDGTLLATASADNHARLWQVKTGKLLQQVAHSRSVARVEFSPDGQSILTSSADGTARIWDVQTGRPRTEPMVHGDDIRAATFNAKGDSVVTASDDGSARVWDAETGLGLSEILRHREGFVRLAFFSPDGKRVASVDTKGNFYVWDVSPATLPVPGWVPQLAEAIGGQRFAAQHTMALVPCQELLRLKEAIVQTHSTDPWTRKARGLFGEEVSRPGLVTPLARDPAK